MLLVRLEHSELALGGGATTVGGGLGSGGELEGVDEREVGGGENLLLGEEREFGFAAGGRSGVGGGDGLGVLVLVVISCDARSCDAGSGDARSGDAGCLLGCDGGGDDGLCELLLLELLLLLPPALLLLVVVRVRDVDLGVRIIVVDVLPAGLLVRLLFLTVLVPLVPSLVRPGVGATLALGLLLGEMVLEELR